ncbi:MAG: membrane protein insertase YidC, partial [Acidobacteria bacterium]|nr:membrane protein insertase YidC [Acidobacteriota bacterium]NIQ87253.1 membrane protein insertase YidC [Acidobacteriota bacterium]
MDEKRILLAIALSIVIMVGWYAMFPPPKPPVPAAPAQADQPAAREPAGQDAATEPAPGQAAADAGAEPAVDPYEAAEAVTASVEERFTIENQHFSAEFTNLGARLLSFKLREFTNEGQPLELLPPFAVEDNAYLAVELDDRELAKSINRALFKTERETVTGGPDGGGGQRLTFEYSDGLGTEVRKTLTIWNSEWIWEAGLDVVDRG